MEKEINKEIANAVVRGLIKTIIKTKIKVSDNLIAHLPADLKQKVGNAKNEFISLVVDTLKESAECVNGVVGGAGGRRGSDRNQIKNIGIE